MQRIIKLNPQNHFSWGDNCEGWHLAQNDELSVIKERMPPYTEETPHYHKHAQQVFYILNGIAEFEIGKEKLIANPGEAVSINALEVHTIKNNTERDLIFLVISSPCTSNDRIEEEPL